MHKFFYTNTLTPNFIDYWEDKDTTVSNTSTTRQEGILFR